MLSDDCHLCYPSLTSLPIATHLFVGGVLVVLFLQLDWRFGKQQQWQSLFFLYQKVPPKNIIPCIIICSGFIFIFMILKGLTISSELLGHIY